jgi:hypothetical protein
MFANSRKAGDRNALNSAGYTAAKCTGEAGNLKSRAERYRQLAESLHDPKIIAVVLACARELDEYAAAMLKPGQPDLRLIRSPF